MKLALTKINTVKVLLMMLAHIIVFVNCYRCIFKLLQYKGPDFIQPIFIFECNKLQMCSQLYNVCY